MTSRVNPDSVGTYDETMRDYNPALKKARKEYQKMYKRYRLGQASRRQVERAKRHYDSIHARLIEALIISITKEVGQINY